MTIVIMHIISKSTGTYSRRATLWDRSAYSKYTRLDHARGWNGALSLPQGQNSRGAEKEARVTKGEEGNYSQLG